MKTWNAFEYDNGYHNYILVIMNNYQTLVDIFPVLGIWILEC